MKTQSPLAATLAATLLLAQVFTPSSAASKADRIVGAWEFPNVRIFHCTSGQPLAQFRAASLFHAGGTMVDTNNAPPTTRGPAFGTWAYDPATGDHLIRMRLYRYQADGGFAGSSEVTRTARLSEDGDRMTETFRAKLIDPAENVLVETCGSSEGVRSL